MSMPQVLQQLIAQELKLVRENPKHLVPPIARQTIYETFNLSSHLSNDAVRKWLEVLTVKHILPIWKNWHEDWSLYPTPEQLVEIAQSKLEGKLDRNVRTDIESTAREMSDLTGESLDSPFYPTWCVFEAAVSLSTSTRDDLINESDEDWKSSSDDVTRYALIVYAGRIDSQITNAKELQNFWEWWYYESHQNTVLPWKHYFDPQACLEFWEWWLTEAIPQAWELANQDSADKTL